MKVDRIYKQPGVRQAGLTWRWALVALAVVLITAGVIVATPNAASVVSRAAATPQVAPARTAGAVVPRVLPPFSWQTPVAGSAYVLDTSEPGPKSRLVLVTPSGQTHHVAELNSNPMIAVSPTAGLVAMASTVNSRDTVRILRSVDGTLVREVTVTHRLMTLAPISTMAFSSDGRYLYVLTLEILMPGVDRYGLSVTDLSTGKTTPALGLGPCGVGTLLAFAEGVAVACAQTVHIYRDPTASAPPLQVEAGSTPASAGGSGRPLRITGAAVTTDGRIVLVFDSGEVRAIRALTGRGAAEVGNLDLAGRSVLTRQVVGSPSSNQVFVLTSTENERVRGVGSQLLVIDATSLAVVGRSGIEATTIALSPDSSRLFALDATSRLVRTIDLMAGGAVRENPGIGVTPWLIVSAR